MQDNIENNDIDFVIEIKAISSLSKENGGIDIQVHFHTVENIPKIYEGYKRLFYTIAEKNCAIVNYTHPQKNNFRNITGIQIPWRFNIVLSQYMREMGGNIENRQIFLELVGDCFKKLRDEEEGNIIKRKELIDYWFNEEKDFFNFDTGLNINQSKLFSCFLFVEKGIGLDLYELIDLEEVISSRPGDPGLLKWRATLYIDKGEYLLGKRDILEVLNFQPDAEAQTYLGLAYYNLNYPDSALMSLNKAIELDVNYLPAYFYAGSFCLQEGEYDLALKYINLVLRLDPKNPTALFYKGIALVEKKNFDVGCSCLNKAFYLGLDDAGDYLKEYCYEVED